MPRLRSHALARKQLLAAGYHNIMVDTETSLAAFALIGYDWTRFTTIRINWMGQGDVISTKLIRNDWSKEQMLAVPHEIVSTIPDVNVERQALGLEEEVMAARSKHLRPPSPSYLRRKGEFPRRRLPKAA